MKNGKVKGAVDDRMVGKRKAALKPDRTSAKMAKKARNAKKDPNKRPVLFLFSCWSLLAFSLYLVAPLEKLSDLSPVLCDSEEFRKTFKAENPNVKAVSAVGKAGGQKWKSLSPTEKAPYEEKAAKKKAEYEKLMNAYNKKQTNSVNGRDEESDKFKSEVNDEEDEASGEDAHQEEEDEEENDEDEDDEDDD